MVASIESSFFISIRGSFLKYSLKGVAIYHYYGWAGWQKEDAAWAAGGGEEGCGRPAALSSTRQPVGQQLGVGFPLFVSCGGHVGWQVFVLVEGGLGLVGGMIVFCQRTNLEN